jgi:hypothetical protein
LGRTSTHFFRSEPKSPDAGCIVSVAGSRST